MEQLPKKWVETSASGQEELTRRELEEEEGGRRIVGAARALATAAVLAAGVGSGWTEVAAMEGGSRGFKVAGLGLEVISMISVEELSLFLLCSETWWVTGGKAAVAVAGKVL